MLQLAAQIDEAVAAVRAKWTRRPRAGIILGTGLGSLAGQIETEATLDYESIPHFPRSTTVGHAGQLVCGRLQGVPVVAMEGRFHAYEGYSQRQITFPVRVMRALGAEMLIVSNACGGMNPQFGLGDIVVLEDHINLMNGNPLIGVNDDQLGPRFPDMSAPYDRGLLERAGRVAEVGEITDPSQIADQQARGGRPQQRSDRPAAAGQHPLGAHRRRAHGRDRVSLHDDVAGRERQQLLHRPLPVG